MTFEGGFHPLNSFFRKKRTCLLFFDKLQYNPKISKIGGGGLPMFSCQSAEIHHEERFLNDHEKLKRAPNIVFN